MPRSLRSRLIVASVLWTSGLLLLLHLLSFLLHHAVPMPRGRMALVPVAVGVALMVAGLWAARRSLLPLRGLWQQVEDIRHGTAPRVAGAFPSEVQPLVDNLNALLAEREKTVERAYRAAGDLAHGLKTPLALLQQDAGDPAAIDQHVRRMAHLVDYHLARARAAATNPVGATATALAPVVDGLVRTLAKLHASRELRIEASATGEVRVRREDLEEMLGNVLDNACQWARSRVTLASEGGAILIDDDGPGLEPALRAAVLERGVRADESAPGSGLGLAIVRELASHYGGEVSLDGSPLGGLRVRLRLPV